MNTRLGDILSEAEIITDLHATDRWEAIDELINKLVAAGRIKPEHHDSINAAVRKREVSMTTGIGFGIGIPHASTDLIHRAVAAFGRAKQHINFDALDGQPVHLVILFLIPQNQFQQHLLTVAEISKLLRNASVRQALEQAPDAATLLRIIKGNQSSFAETI
jgi:mannitol/fructose-specific phosphotransferase system IIA component (Ntr-type)